MAYVVQRGTDKFSELDTKAAFAKALELIAENRGKVVIRDSDGNPVGLHEIDLAIASVKFD